MCSNFRKIIIIWLVTIFLFTSSDIWCLATQSGIQTGTVVQQMHSMAEKKLSKQSKVKDKLFGFINGGLDKLKKMLPQTSKVKAKINKIDWGKALTYSLLLSAPLYSGLRSIQRDKTNITWQNKDLVSCKSGLGLGFAGTLIMNNPLFLAISGLNCLPTAKAIATQKQQILSKEPEFFEIEPNVYILGNDTIYDQIDNLNAPPFEMFFKGDVLNITMEDGSPLPDWIKSSKVNSAFCNTHGNANDFIMNKAEDTCYRLEGTAPIKEEYSLGLEIRYNNKDNKEIMTEDFRITGEFGAYILGKYNISNQVAGIDNPFIIKLKGSVKKVTQENGDSLPDWLDLTPVKKIGSCDTPGEAREVIMNQAEDTLYVADWQGGIQIIDITNVSNPEIIGSCDTPGGAVGLIMNQAEDALYVADDRKGIQIIDITNVSNPEIIGNCSTPGWAFGLIINKAEDTLYVADWQGGIQIIDITNVSNPEIIGNCSTPGQAFGLIMNQAEDILYVADYDQGIQIIDITNASNPEIIGGCDTPGWASEVIVNQAEDTLYVADYDQGIQIIDITNVSNPEIIGACDILGDAEGLIMNKAEDILYVADYDQGIQIIDITNASNPEIIGGCDTPGDASGLIMNKAEDTLYIGDGAQGIQILGFDPWFLSGKPHSQDKGKSYITVSFKEGSDIRKDVFKLTVEHFPLIAKYIPERSINIDTKFYYRIKGSEIFNDLDGDNLFLRLFIEDYFSLPEWLTFENHIISCYYTTGDANSVLRNKAEDTLCVADSGGGIQIIDISDVTHPEIIGGCDTPGQALGLIMNKAEDTLYVADLGGGIQIIDITNASNPEIISGCDTPGEAAEVIVNQAEDTLYVAAYDQGIQIIDITNVSNPEIIGVCDTPGEANEVIMNKAEDTLYVADLRGGIQIIDITNVSNPEIIGGYVTPGDARGLIMNQAEDTLYVADKDQGIQIIDISDVTHPEIIGSCATPGQAFGLIMNKAEDTLYVADDDQGIQIIDITNVSNPEIIGSCATPGDAVGLIMNQAEDTLYVADWGGGIQIIDLDEWVLSGTPSKGDAGNYNLQLRASDPDKASVSQVFTLRVEGPPVLKESIPYKRAKIGKPFNFFIPQGTFIDPNEDTIHFEAKEKGRTKLPDWMRFNAFSAAFSGIPEKLRNYTIEVTASDITTGKANTTFAIYVDHNPIVENEISDQVADIGKNFSCQIPSNIFNDPDNDELTYFAKLSNGLHLPEWLNFTSTAEFHGFPDIKNEIVYEIEVSANDGKEGEISTVFKLTVEHFPVFKLDKIPAQLAAPGHEFTLNLLDKFDDKDDKKLDFIAIQKNGEKLPRWLSLDPSNCIFSGTPTAPEDLNITITAKDSKGGSVDTTFKIKVRPFPEIIGLYEKQIAVVTNNIPRILNQIPDIHAQTNELLDFTIPDNTFFDPDDDVLTYTFSLTKISSNLLDSLSFVRRHFKTKTDIKDPGWLSIDHEKRHFKGTPESKDAYAYTPKIFTYNVTANDGANSSSTRFYIILEGPSLTENLINYGLTIFGGLGTAYGFYNQKYILWNKFKKKKYIKPKQKIYVSDGRFYQHKITAISSEDVKTVKVLKPIEKSFPFSIFGKKEQREYPGGSLLPLWLEYVPGTNVIRSKPNTATFDDLGIYSIEVVDYDNRIREQFELEVYESREHEKRITENNKQLTKPKDTTGVKMGQINNPLLLVQKSGPGIKKGIFRRNGKKEDIAPVEIRSFDQKTAAPLAYNLYNESGQIKEDFEIKDYYKTLNFDTTEYIVKRIPDIEKPPYHIFNQWQGTRGIICISEKMLAFIENQDKESTSFLLSNSDNEKESLDLKKLEELLKRKGAGTIALENKIREEIVELDARKDWLNKNTYPLMLSGKINSQRITFEIQSAIRSFEGMSIEEVYISWKVWGKWLEYEISYNENINKATEHIIKMHKEVYEYMVANNLKELGKLISDAVKFEDNELKGRLDTFEGIIASGQVNAYCA